MKAGRYRYVWGSETPAKAGETVEGLGATLSYTFLRNVT